MTMFDIPDGWGAHGSIWHQRYAEVIEDRRRARKCGCGCGGRSTLRMMANGVCLGQGCDRALDEWIASPIRHYRLSRERRA